MGRFKGRKILGVILFCFVFCAVCGLPASAVKNNLFILLLKLQAVQSSIVYSNITDNHLLSTKHAIALSDILQLAGGYPAFLFTSTAVIGILLFVALSLFDLLPLFISLLKLISIPRLITLCFLLFAFAEVGKAQSQTFNTSGTFKVPAGVTNITVELWGGGGGGAIVNGAAGGGGGGAYTKGTLSGLISGDLIPVTVGSGGATGSDGSPSFIGSISAKGGHAGNLSTGGAGGAASVIGGNVIVSFAGGTGGNAMTTIPGPDNEGGGGGGGSALGTAVGGNGETAISATGGVGGTGAGAGGRGADGDGTRDAVSGTIPGGGGGGRGEKDITSSKAGAAGLVIISWNCPANAGILSGASRICASGGTTTFTSTVIGGTWESSNPSYADIHPTSGLVTAQSTGAEKTVTITYKVASEGCPDQIVTKDLIVDPLLTIGTASESPTLCIKTPMLTSIIHSTTGATGIGTATGLPAGVTAVWAANTITISGTPTEYGTFNYSIPVVATCGNSDATGKIIVNPSPTLTGATQLSSVCEGSGATINLTGLLKNSTSEIDYKINGVVQPTVTGIVADGSGTASFITGALTAANNGQTLQIIGITTTSATPSCSKTLNMDVTLMVNAATKGGTVTSTRTTICSGDVPADLTLNGNVGEVIKWQKANNLAFSSPTDIPVTTTTLNGATIGNLISTTYFRAVVKNGVCPSEYSIPVSIAVNFAPSISVQPSTPLATCSGIGTRSMSITATGTGLSYSWRKNNVDLVNDAVVSGQGTTTLTLTNPTTAYAGNYDVVVSGTCSPSVTSAAVPVTVYSIPTVTASPVSQIICSGTNINKIVLGGAVAGTTYNWVRDNVTNVTGISTSGVGDISGSLINTTTNQQTVKFTITPTANGCSGSPIEASVIVYPKLSAVISVNGNSSICSGKSTEIWISFTGSGPFRYAINNGTEVTATGNPEKLTVSPVVSTTYTVTSLRDDNCVAQPTDITGSAVVTVLPLPQLTSPLSTSVCSGKAFSYTPGMSIVGSTYKWVRATVPGISNASSSGTGAINEILTNTTSAPVNVVYTFELTSPNPQACTKSQNVVVTVNPMPGLTVSADRLRACVGDPITIFANPGSVSGYTYSLIYVPDGSNIYPTPPTFVDNTIGSFVVYPIVGKHTYRLTATNAQGCSYSQEIQVKVYDIPNISIIPSCSEQSVTMSGTMIGTSSNPSNFTGSDIGRIEYSYDNGITWRTDTYWGPNLPLGVFAVLARNSAAIDVPNSCNTSISANITYTSVLTENVGVCQGLPAPSFSAVALCSGWSSSSQINNLNPSNSDTYHVSSSANAPYTQGPLVAFLATEIFTVNKNNPQITFDDCNNNQGANFSYSIYEYPFNAANPSHGFVTMVTACPKVTIPLNPNKYYQIIVNDYDPNSNHSASIKFNGNDRSQVLNNTTEIVSWYKADGTFIVSNNTFNPVPSIIPNTDTPGNWKFYAACGTSSCRQEVNFTIDPIPTGSAAGSNLVVTCSSQETNIQLKSVDKYGNPVPPGSVSYTWKTDITAQDLSKITITHNTCTSGCSEVIRETVTNTGTTTAIVDFTITPKGGDCVGQDFHVFVKVEPMPDFSINNTNTVICPSANPQIVPIQVVSLNSSLISGLQYIWNRTNTSNLPASPVGSVPASGIGSANGFAINGTLGGPFPNSLQTTVFTVEAQVNDHTCVTKTTAVTVGDEIAPVITCPSISSSFDCITKIPAAATDYSSFIALGGVATDNCTVQPVVSHVGDVLISGTYCNGIIRRTYRARDYAGNTSECSQNINIVNNSLPTFSTTPPAALDRCVYDISYAIFNPLTVDLMPYLDGSPARPDYYRLTNADKAILSNIASNGTCNITLHWKLLDSNNDPIRDENSDLLQDKTDALSSHPIKLAGSAANDVNYRLIYWLVDGCGRKSADYTVVITIHPRPIINKVTN